jgi:hypothetical protein
MSSRQARRRLKRRRMATRAGLVGGGALAFALVPVATAEASVYKVTNLKDSGPGSLRAAITAADATGAPATAADVITFSSKLSGSIELTSALPEIEDAINIIGPGARKVAISGKKLSKHIAQAILYDSTANSLLRVAGLSFENVDIDVETGQVVTADGDETKLELYGDSFSHIGPALAGASVYGGGGGSLDIYRCTFSGSEAAVAGGAVYAKDEFVSIDDSTFVGNRSYLTGGAIFLTDALAAVDSSTITRNSVTDYDPSTNGPEGYGGGLSVVDADVDLGNSIVAGNTASGNLGYPGGPVGGSNHNDIYLGQGATVDTYFSLIGSDWSGISGLNLESNDILGKNPELGPLRDNGGGTNTEAPTAKSPVINAGTDKEIDVKVDQRGLKRTVAYPGVKKKNGSDGTDIGAVELQPPPKHKRK